MNLGYITRN